LKNAKLASCSWIGLGGYLRVLLNVGLIVIAAQIASGCQTPPPELAANPGKKKLDSKVCIENYQWLLPGNGKTFFKPQDYLVWLAKNKHIVLLGEHHDQPEHHRWQLQVLISLYTLHPDMVIGFEMFPRSTQPVLDQWVQGELDEKAFLKKVQWTKNWNFDANLYLPMFHFARMNHIPLVALNVDRALVLNVRKNGWENVAVAARQGIRDPAPMSEAYLQFMEGIFRQHSVHKSESSEQPQTTVDGIRDDPKFRHFIQGQQLWDAAMAQGLAAQVRSGRLVVGVMGSGHIVQHFGVPHQFKYSGVDQFASLVPWHQQFECDQLNADFADAVVGLPTGNGEDDKVSKPRLGIYMEPHTQGVKIVRVVKDSVAQHTGLLAEDIVIEMAGQSISETSQIAEIVNHMLLGSWLPIKVKRHEKELEFIAKFPAENNHKPGP